MSGRGGQQAWERARVAHVHASKMKDADAWEVAADAWEEYGAFENAAQSRLMAELTRDGKNPSLAKLPDGTIGIVHDEPAKVTGTWGPAGPTVRKRFATGSTTELGRTLLPKNAMNKGRFARRT